MVFFLAVATTLGLAFQKLSLPETNIVLCYLFAVVLTAWLTRGYLYGIISCVAGTLLFNWFFAKPIHTLTVDDPSYWVTFMIMTIIAIITSSPERYSEYFSDVLHIILRASGCFSGCGAGANDL